MSRFVIHPQLPLAGLVLIERKPQGDERGAFCRMFCAEELACAGWQQPIVQINHTVTRQRGTVRGLHYQNPPHAEMKLVSCIRGEVWDVVVDLRRDSPTFLNWHAERLSAGNARALLIPQGFAHGFQALSDDVEMLYCHSATYEPDFEGGLNPADPLLLIDWPLPVAGLSPRDASHSRLTPAFAGLDVR